jgi:DNA-binding MarR family transcriptional regulator
LIVEFLEDRKIRLSRQSRQELIGELFDQIRASQNVSDAFDDAVCRKLGINRTDHRCVDVLERMGPLTAGELAERLHLSTGAVTTVIDRLERKGLAHRARDAADRRRVVVELTEGARALGVYYEPLARGAMGLVEPYSDAQLRLMVEFMRAGNEMTEAALRDLLGE